MDPDDAIKTLYDQTIPTAIGALKESQKTLDQIAQYCRESKKKDDYDGVFQQTQDYTKDALMNVAYHVHTVGTHLTSFLHFQAREMDKLDLKIGTLTARMKGCHDAAGEEGFNTKESARTYTVGNKMSKLDDSSLPEASKFPQPCARQKITIDSLDQMNLLIAYSPDNTISAPPPSLVPIAAAAMKVKKKKLAAKNS